MHIMDSFGTTLSKIVPFVPTAWATSVRTTRHEVVVGPTNEATLLIFARPLSFLSEAWTWSENRGITS